MVIIKNIINVLLLLKKMVIVVVKNDEDIILEILTNNNTEKWIKKKIKLTLKEYKKFKEIALNLNIKHYASSKETNLFYFRNYEKKIQIEITIIYK